MRNRVVGTARAPVVMSPAAGKRHKGNCGRDQDPWAVREQELSYAVQQNTHEQDQDGQEKTEYDGEQPPHANLGLPRLQSLFR